MYDKAFTSLFGVGNFYHITPIIPKNCYSKEPSLKKLSVSIMKAVIVIIGKDFMEEVVPRMSLRKRKFLVNQVVRTMSTWARKVRCK